MHADFTSIRNHYERPVLEAVAAMAARYPFVRDDQLPDVACVALNRLPPRYIRHEVDLAFYLTAKERIEIERSIEDGGPLRVRVRPGPHRDARPDLTAHMPRKLGTGAPLPPRRPAGRTRMVGKLAGRVCGKSRL